MKIINLVIMGISMYSLAFALCILYKILDNLEQSNKQTINMLKMKIIFSTFLILLVYPFYLAYKKYIKHNYKSISLAKLYYNTILSTPTLLNTAISILIANEKNVVMK